ncbi:MAG: hypothetical protein AAB152_12005 [Candidatus Coatesbacteria bacterium]
MPDNPRQPEDLLVGGDATKAEDREQPGIASDDLAKLFFERFEPHHLFFKMHLLLAHYRDAETFVPSFCESDLPLTDQNMKDLAEGFRRFVKVETHFMYFQMIELLFQLLFVVAHYPIEEIWPALTFTNDRRSRYYMPIYRLIRAYGEGTLDDPKMAGSVRLIDQDSGKEYRLPLVAVRIYDHWLTQIPHEKLCASGRNIEELLRIFAQDFSTRGAYNAYKHALRFVGGFSVSRAKETEGRTTFEQSWDPKSTLTYLRRTSRLGQSAEDQEALELVTRKLDFYRDWRCCEMIYKLITTTMTTRTPYILKDWGVQPAAVALFDKVVPGDYAICVEIAHGMSRSTSP